jgi:hypothetical protein
VSAVVNLEHVHTRTTVLPAVFGCGIVALAALLLLAVSATASDEFVAARALKGQLFAPGSFWTKATRSMASSHPASATAIRGRPDARHAFTEPASPDGVRP